MNLEFPKILSLKSKLKLKFREPGGSNSSLRALVVRLCEKIFVKNRKVHIYYVQDCLKILISLIFNQKTVLTRVFRHNYERKTQYLSFWTKIKEFKILPNSKSMFLKALKVEKLKNNYLRKLIGIFRIFYTTT